VSTVYYFVCEECNSYVWAGQSTTVDGERLARIYGYTGIPKWLNLHMGHEIMFTSEHGIEDDAYDRLIEWTYDNEMLNPRAKQAEQKAKRP